MEAWYTAGGGFTCAKIFSGTPMLVSIQYRGKTLFVIRFSSIGGIGLRRALFGGFGDTEEGKRWPKATIRGIIPWSSCYLWPSPSFFH